MDALETAQGIEDDLPTDADAHEIAETLVAQLRKRGVDAESKPESRMTSDGHDERMETTFRVLLRPEGKEDEMHVIAAANHLDKRVREAREVGWSHVIAF